MGVYADLRARVADALDDLNPEWSVHPAPVDALDPPAFVLVWGDPWSIRSTGCSYNARLDVVCIAGRIDPAPGIETIELMVEGAAVTLDAAKLPATEITAPGPFEIGGVQYLAARMLITAPIRARAVSVSARATLAASVTLTVEGTGAAAGASVTLSASVTLTVTGTRAPAVASVTLAASVTLTATGTIPATGSATLAASVTLAAVGSLAPPPWTPAAITGLKAWYDASNLASITAAGGLVSQWNDLSPSAAHLTQGTATNQPSTGTRTQNGLNVVDFDGADNGMQGALTVAQPWTMFAALVVDAYSTGGADPSLFQGTAYQIFTQYGGWRAYLGAGSVVGGAAVGGALLTIVGNGASCVLKHNGVAGTPDNAGTIGWQNNGAGGGPGRPADLAICEIITYQGVISGANEAAVVAYLRAKWGLP